MFPPIGGMVIVGVHGDGRFVGTLVARDGNFVMLHGTRAMNGRVEFTVIDGVVHVKEKDFADGVPSKIAYDAMWLTECVVDE